MNSNGEENGGRSHRTQIFVALIALVGVLAAALIADWDKVFPSKKTEHPAVATPPPTSPAFPKLEAALPERSIAVLPFADMSQEGDQKYFSDGLAEELSNLLAKIPELRVISRSSAFSFNGKGLDIPTIAAQLKVRHILEGSVRRDGQQIRITAQLIDAHSDAHLWSETYDRPMQSIFAVQDEISAKVVKKLRISLLGEIPKVVETSPKAYELYLRARHLDTLGTRESFAKAVELYQEALDLDPHYARAWVGLAAAYNNQTGKGILPYLEGYALAREAAGKALDLDPDNALALARLGWISMVFDGDLTTAANYIQRSLSLVPGNSLEPAAVLARALGRPDMSVRLFEHMVARDPVNGKSRFNLGIYYNVTGRFDDAISSFRKSLELSPGRIAAYYGLGIALLLKGEPEMALAEMSQETFEGYRLVGQAVINHTLGRNEDSDAMVEQLKDKGEDNWQYNLAYVHAWRGENDLAFERLGRAAELGDPGLSEIHGQRLFANLHEDPRWLPFLESIGKSPKQLAAIEFEVVLPE